MRKTYLAVALTALSIGYSSFIPANAQSFWHQIKDQALNSHGGQYGSFYGNGSLGSIYGNGSHGSVYGRGLSPLQQRTYSAVYGRGLAPLQQRNYSSVYGQGWGQQSLQQHQLQEHQQLEQQQGFGF